MSQSTQGPLSARYQLRVAGHLDTHWSARFDDLTLTQHHDGTTTLTGLIRDQSQLHGVLAKVRDLGLTLISIRVLNQTQIDEDAEGKDRCDRHADG
jgi:hypothetical protein